MYIYIYIWNPPLSACFTSPAFIYLFIFEKEIDIWGITQNWVMTVAPPLYYAYDRKSRKRL